MKKLLLLFSLLLALGFTGCGEAKDNNVIKVGATPVPHAELLELVKDDLETKGYTLEIVEFTDYVTPNMSLSSGDIDANFFQHKPYLDEFAKENKLELTSIGSVHVEPLGLYSEQIKSLEELEEGSTIAIPSDSVNGGRALILLENNGLIKLSDDAGLKATENDIIENPKNLTFKAIESAQLARVLKDVEGAVINGNFALQAGFVPTKDALILEGSESPYVNIVVAQTAHKDDEKLIALVEALQSDEVKAYIQENYEGAVVEAFSK